MKQTTNRSHIPLLVLAAGLAGSFSRAALYLVGTDAYGLLVAGHPLQGLCWVLTIGAALCLWAVLRKTDESSNYAFNFPQNPRVLPMAILAAAGTMVTVLHEPSSHDRMTLIWAVLGLLSAIALVFIGICRATGKQPKFYLYGLLCLFYAVHMVCCYKVWSGKPQIADYCFALLACACLIIGAYQRTAFSAGIGNRRAHLFFSLMAGFFCILCVPGSEHPWLYLTNGCFFLSDSQMTLPQEGQV